MKKALTGISLLISLLTHAQLYNDQLFVISGGVFESMPPFSDFVTVASFNPISKQYQNLDLIKSQSTQGALCDGDYLYVLTSDSIVKYNTVNGLRTAIAKFPGASPSPGSIAVSSSKLAVGNWYGQTDSNLYVFDKNTLQLLYQVQGIHQQAKGIVFYNDTLIVAQNIKGSVDNCPPFGCFNDSIGEIRKVNANNGQVISVHTLTALEGGVQSMFVKGNILWTVNQSGSSITRFNLSTNTYNSSAISGVVGRGIALDNNLLFFEKDGKSAAFDVNSSSVIVSPLSLFSYPAAIVMDTISDHYFETTTDYSSFGKLYVTQQALLDSVSTGVSPEGLALHYRMNMPPLALNDSISILYTTDTTVAVLENDTDSTLASYTVTIVDSFNVVGSFAFVDTNMKIHVIPALGIETTDELTYRVCDGLGGCSEAKLVVKITGFDGVAEIDLSDVKVYPNPFRDFILVQSYQPLTLIELFDMHGKVVSQNATGANRIEVQNLPQGIYFMKVSTVSGKNIFHKLIHNN